ncbi:MAG: hypothetical protein KDB27_15680 [Planctomycetales bacterium]|nr:hypothetical protein [Planctomycetales bacterium]
MNIQITLTGERRRRRFMISINHHDLWVSYAQLNVILQLLRGRESSSTGYIRDPDSLYPKAIYELRTLLNKEIDENFGHKLIETGGVVEYRIVFDDIILSDSFEELVAIDVVSRDEFLKLQEKFGHRSDMRQ